MFTRLSFAPFAFSALSFAILDLIEQIKEEQKQVYGSGRRTSSAHEMVLPRESEADIEQAVRDKWAAVESAQVKPEAGNPVSVIGDMGIPITEHAPEPAKPAEPVAIAAPVRMAPAVKPVPVTQDISAQVIHKPLAQAQAQKTRQRLDDETALTLMRAEL